MKYTPFFGAHKKKLEEFSPPNFFFEAHGPPGIIVFCSCVGKKINDPSNNFDAPDLDFEMPDLDYDYGNNCAAS